ncbi:Nucleoporin nup49 protein [Neofusicoccum parvum]|nr:Nucleoporin nup49 protein [Neofusicoccum parvum]
MSFGTGLGKGGGLSINTGGGSSLFGSSTSTSQPQSGGSLFGAGTSTSTSQPQSSGGLFGASTNNATPQAQGNSLFGGALNKPATPATTTSTGGLFGGGATGATPASQPQTGGSLFGGALGQNQQQGQQQQQPPPQQPQQGGGLFGQSTQTAQTATPSLFGSSTAQTQNKPSLFSNTTNTAQQPQQTSLFGSAMNNTQQPAAGGLFGASAQNPNAGGQATIPGVRIDLSQIRGSTRFSDLHEDVQKQIEQMDALIQQQISHHDQCQAFIDGRLKENISYLPNDVEWVNGKCEAVETALDNDSQAISQLKQTIKNDVENARITFRVLENLKLPTQFHYTGSMWSTAPAPAKSASPDDPSADGSNTDLVSFFSSQTDEMDKTLEHQARLLSEIEQHLRTVEANTLQQGQELMARRGAGNAEEHHENRLRELALLFNEIQKAIMNEAQNVGDCREKVIEATVGASGIGR